MSDLRFGESPVAMSVALCEDLLRIGVIARWEPAVSGCATWECRPSRVAGLLIRARSATLSRRAGYPQVGVHGRGAHPDTAGCRRASAGAL